MLTTEGSKDPLLDMVKIKQEKLTPPASPNVNSSSATGLNISNDLLDNILGERKPIAEPIKSSNEILADLFKVFNAAPPTLDGDNITTKESNHKKKKHKKEKKVKKHKKHSRNNSEYKSSGDESQKTKKHKVKKAKKREAEEISDTVDSKNHKRHKKSKENEIKIEKTDIVVKKEKIIDANSKTDNDSKSHVDAKSKSHDDPKSKTHDTDTNSKKSSDLEKNPPLNIQVSVTKDNDGSGSKRKIVIKSLVDSSVYQDTLKEVDAKQKEKEREKLKEKERQKEKEREKKEIERSKDRERRKHSLRRSKSNEKEHRRGARSHSSSLSLSDEETYLRERERDVRTRVSILKI